MSTSTKSIGIKGLVVTALALLGNVVAADSGYTLSHLISLDSTSAPALALPNGAVSHAGFGNMCDNPCAIFLSGGIVADFKVFSDSNCRDQISQVPLITEGPMMMCPMTYASLPTARDWWPSTVFVQAGKGFDHNAQLIFTSNQDDSLGENFRFARGVLTAGSKCLGMSGINTSWGMKYFPCGSGGLLNRRRDFVDEGNVTDTVQEPIRRSRQARTLPNDN